MKQALQTNKLCDKTSIMNTIIQQSIKFILHFKLFSMASPKLISHSRLTSHDNNFTNYNNQRGHPIAMPLLNKYEVYVFTFLCYTSIHSLRTSYSYSKNDIARDVDVQSKYMGIVDSLMLTFLGLGHFLHALYPIKKPVLSLWIAMIICGINYALIPACVNVSALANIYIVCVLMSFNGFLQSYTWPNLLMIINSRFNPQKYAVLLGFWSANANVGNIIGFGVFEILKNFNYKAWEYGLFMCAIYAAANGVYIGWRFDELPIAGAKQVRQQSFMQYDGKSRRFDKANGQKDLITSVASLSERLLQSQDKKSEGKSVHSEVLIGKANSISGLSRRSIQTLKQISSKISRGTIKSIRLVDQPEKVAETPLSIIEVFKDPNVVLLTITFSLAKSVIYGIMLWLPLYFKNKGFGDYAAQIPIAYDVAAIFGSVGIGFLFKKIDNKGLLMVPFMVVLFICFFLLKAGFEVVAPYFIIIAVVGFGLGGIFNTLSGLVVMELTKVIPENLKTSSLGFYSALTMAVGNITTALTQVLIGFVIGKENPESIFLVFMIYASVCLVCLIGIAVITWKQKGELSKGEVVVIEEIKNNDDDIDSGGEQVEEPRIKLEPEETKSNRKLSTQEKPKSNRKQSTQQKN